MSAQHTPTTPNLRRLFDLPRGSRFRYVDHPNKTFVLLSYEDSGIVGDAPSNDGNRRLQGLYAADESRAEFEALMVEFVPVVEAAQHDKLLAALVEVMGRVPPDLERADATMNRAMTAARAAIAQATGGQR